MTPTDRATIDYRSEVYRKLIHLCSLSIPVVYFFIKREFALSILIPLTVISLIFDVGRYFFPPLSKFLEIFGFLLRKHEKDKEKKALTGASYVFIAAVLSVLIFPKIVVITSFSVLIIGDTAAALIGRKFGRHRFLAKSLEGTSAFFLSSVIVVILAPKVHYTIWEYLIGFVAVAVGAIVENISYGWADDNLTIPISTAAVLTVLYMLLLPSYNILQLR